MRSAATVSVFDARQPQAADQAANATAVERKDASHVHRGLSVHTIGLNRMIGQTIRTNCERGHATTDEETVAAYATWSS